MSENETTAGVGAQTALDTAAWLAKKAIELETVDDVLPSGLTVKRYQRVSIEKLVMQGKLPLTLLSGLGEQGENGQLEIDKGSMMENIMENLDKYMSLFDALFVAAIAEPIIGEVTDGENGRLALSLFDDELNDKIYIVNKVMGVVTDLQPFRENGA